MNIWVLGNFGLQESFPKNWNLIVEGVNIIINRKNTEIVNQEFIVER